MKLKYTNPESFESKEIEYDKIHYEIANDLQKAAPFTLSKIVSLEGDPDKLGFGIMLPRIAGEWGTKFKVTIERIYGDNEKHDREHNNNKITHNNKITKD